MAKESIMTKAYALKAARYHRDRAVNDGLRTYWNQVIRGIKRGEA